MVNIQNIIMAHGGENHQSDALINAIQFDQLINLIILFFFINNILNIILTDQNNYHHSRNERHQVIEVIISVMTIEQARIDNDV